MTEYLVRWEIELDADSPEDAARIAHTIMLEDDQLQAATYEVAEIEPQRAQQDWHEIDLHAIAQNEALASAYLDAREERNISTTTGSPFRY